MVFGLSSHYYFVYMYLPKLLPLPLPLFGQPTYVSGELSLLELQNAKVSGFSYHVYKGLSLIEGNLIQKTG